MFCDICQQQYNIDTRKLHKHKQKMKSTLTIKEINGTEHIINTTNFDEVKIEISKRSGIPINQQRFFANGKEIFKIEDDIIYVVFNKK